MKEFNIWIEELRNVRFPTYEELPTIPLYSDQVIEYINGLLKPFFESNGLLLTNTMINNYVKQKLMPAPIKKRYTKDHLAYIVTITILKQVISIPNIVLGINRVRDEFSKDEAFNVFIRFVESAINDVIDQTEGKSTCLLQDEKIVDVLIPMKTACIAFAAKLVAERSLENILKQEVKND